MKIIQIKVSHHKNKKTKSKNSDSNNKNRLKYRVKSPTKLKSNHKMKLIKYLMPKLQWLRIQKGKKVNLKLL